MKNLGRKEYCNKLIILTSDVIKKFFKDKDITYLAERVDPNGIPHNAMTTENIIYLDTNSLEATSPRFPEAHTAQIMNIVASPFPLQLHDFTR